MSSLDENSFGWTTASSDDDMYTEDVHHFNVQEKTKKRKVKEESVIDNSVEISENKEVKKEEYGSSSPYVLIKKESDSNMTIPTTVIKKNKHKLLSSTFVSNNDEVISDVSEINNSKRKSKKNKISNIWDDTELNEISKIDNQNTMGNLDLSEISKNVDTNVKEPFLTRVDKKHKKKIKSENLTNGCLRTGEENSNHRDHLQEFYNNIGGAEPETSNSEKRTKKKRKYENSENIDLNTEEISLENMEFSPKKKKKRNLDIEGPAFSQDNNDVEKQNIKSTLIKKEFINASSENDNVSQISDDFTNTKKKSHRINENSSNLSSVKNYNVKKTTSRVPKNHTLSTSSSDSLVSSEINNVNVMKSEKSVNIETEDNESLDNNIKQKHKLKQLVSRVSDKTIFENQTINYGKKIPDQTSDSSKLLLQYILKNKHLKPMKSKYAGDSFLTEDDDIWIMKCPLEINIKTLHDSDLIVGNKCKLKIENQIYQGILNDSKINVAVPFVEGDKFVVKNCVPKGIVRLRKRIPKPHFIQDSNMDNIPGSVPLPETKLRHPLFGFNYKSYLKLPSYVTEKLQNVESTLGESCIGVNRKKKKKKIKIEIEEQPVRISKKRKIDDDSDTNVVKTKRKKHNISAEEMWESEKAIEDNLFNL